MVTELFLQRFAGSRNPLYPPTLDTLKTLTGPFDLVFIDADKENNEQYYEGCLQLLRPGGVVALDNALWGGSVVNASDQRESTRAIRDFNAARAKDERVSVSMVPIGDGVLLMCKR